MMAAAIEMASDIAEKSPVAVQGTKVNLNYARDHSVQDALEFVVRPERQMSSFKSNEAKMHPSSLFPGHVEQFLHAEWRRGEGSDGLDGQGEGRILQIIEGDRWQNKFYISEAVLQT